MGIATTELADGESFQFYVPDGTSGEQAERLAPIMLKRAMMGQDVLSPPPPPERTMFGIGEEGVGRLGEVGGGVTSGLLGLLGTGALGASFLLPEEAEQAVREPIRDFTKAVQAPFAPKRGYEDSLTRKLSEGVGSTVPFIAAGLLSGGSAIPGLVAATGLAGASGTGQAAERAIQAGATEEQISEAARLGTLPGLSEVIVPYGVGKGIRAFRETTKAGRKVEGLFERALGVEETQTLRRRLTRILAAAGGEGLQEASAEIAQNLIAQDVYDPSVGAFEGTGESFGLGAGVGGLIQGLAELAIRGGQRGAGVAPTTTPPLALPAPSPVSVIPPTTPAALPPPQGKLPAPDFPIEEGGVAVAVPPNTQGELFPTAPTTLEGETISEITSEDVANLPNSSYLEKEVVGRNLNDPVVARDVRDKLQAYINIPTISTEVKQNIAQLLKRPPFGAITDTQTTDTQAARQTDPTQITLEDIITTSQEEQAWNARQERGRLKAQAERQARLDTEAAQAAETTRLNEERAAFEASQAQAAEQRAANEAVRDVGRPPAGTPTAMGAAMAAAETTGRRGPDGRQLEIPAIPPVNPIDAQIAAEQRRIESEGVPSDAGPAPIQGELLGPRGGARGPAGGFNQPRVNRKKVAKKKTAKKVVAKKKAPVINKQEVVPVKDQDQKQPAAATTAAKKVKKAAKKVATKAKKAAGVVGTAVGTAAAKAKAPQIDDQKKDDSEEVKPLSDVRESVSVKGKKKQPAAATTAVKKTAVPKKKVAKKKAAAKKKAVAKEKVDLDTEVVDVAVDVAAAEEVVDTEVAKDWWKSEMAAEEQSNFKAQLTKEAKKIGQDIEKVRAWDRKSKQERKGTRRPKAITSTSQNLSVPDQKAIRDAEEIVGEYFTAYQGPLAPFFKGTAAPDQISLGDQKIANAVLRAMAADAALNDVGYSPPKLKQLGVETRAKAGLQAAEWVENNLSKDGKNEGRNQFNKYREEHKEYYELGDNFVNRVMDDKAMIARRKAAADALKKKKTTEEKEEARAVKATEAQRIKDEADVIATQKVRKKVTEIEEEFTETYTPTGTLAEEITKNKGKDYEPSFESQVAAKYLNKIANEYGPQSKEYQTTVANIYQRDPKLLEIQQAEYAERGGKTTEYSLRGEEITDNFLELPKHAIATSMGKIPLTIRNAIRKGDIKRVYQILSESPNSAIASMAQGILDNLGTTKIRNGYRMKFKGTPLAGGFSPIDNTIVINVDPISVLAEKAYGERGDISIHTLLHEGAHAVTSHTIADPTKELDPYVVQLRRIYESVKDKISSAYGSKNLDEFVAEAYSNMEFRSEINRMSGKDIGQTVWGEVSRIFNNIIRRIMGKNPIPKNKIQNPLDYVDNLIQSILNPAPSTRNAPLLPLASSAYLRGVGDVARMKVLSKTDLAANIEIIKNWLKDVSIPVWNLVTEFLPLNVLVDIYKGDIPSLNLLFKEIQKKVGARQRYLTRTKDTAQYLKKVFKGHPEARKIFNDVVHSSTLARVDPSRSRDYYARYWVEWKKNTGTEANPVWRTQPAKPFDSAKERDAFIKSNKLKDPDSLETKNVQTWGGSSTSQKVKAYDKLQVQWKKLGKKEQKAYVKLRDAYGSMYKQIMDSMEARINEITDNPNRRKTLSDRIFEKISHKDKIEPYFPLFRKGKYWLEFKVDGSPELHKMLFPSLMERRVMEGRLKKRGKVTILKTNDQKGTKVTSSIEHQDMNTSLAFSILNGLEQAGASRETKDRMMEVILDTMPESAIANSFRPREGTLGFAEDAIEVFEQRMPSFATQLVNLKYDLPMQNADEKIREEINQGKEDNPRLRAFYENTVKGYMQFVGNPEISSFSKALKSAGFAATLGVNVSSVLVNATNLPIVVFPYLGGKYGYNKAGVAMNKARSIFFRTGSKRQMTGFEDEELGMTWDGPNLTNIDWNDPKSIPEGIPHHLAELSQLMDLRGQANRSTVGDMIDYDNPSSNMWMKANNAMGFMFHQGERMNRQITAIAAYELHLDKIAKTKGGRSALRKQDYKDAAEQALFDIEITNSGAMTETAGRLAQGNIGSVALMYKRFGISMYYLQFKMAREAMLQNATLGRQSVLDKGGTQKEADAEFDRIENDQRAARRQIAGLFAMSGLMAGVQGLPLYGLVSLIANTVFLDDEDDDFDSIAADFVGEGLYSGAINHITNLDIAPRIGMTNLVYRTLPNSADQHAVMDALEFLGGPVYGVGKRWIDGAGLAGEGEIQRGVEKMLPSFASNPMKAYRYAMEGATTMRGDPITEDIGPWNVAAQALGLVPASYTKQLELNAVEKRKERVKNEKRTDLLRKLYRALVEEGGDADAVSDVLDDISEFSKDNPFFAINGRTINRSIRQHVRTTQDVAETGGVTFSRRNRARVVERMQESLGIE